jgi:hypothetical protein
MVEIEHGVTQLGGAVYWLTVLQVGKFENVAETVQPAPLAVKPVKL